MLPSIYNNKRKNKVNNRKKPSKHNALTKSKSLSNPNIKSKLSLHDIVNQKLTKSYPSDKKSVKNKDTTSDDIEKLLQRNTQRKKLLSLINKSHENSEEGKSCQKGYTVIYENRYNLDTTANKINTDPQMLHTKFNKSLKTTFEKILLLNTSLKFFFEYKPSDTITLHNIKIIYNSINIKESNLGLLPKVMIVKCDEYKEKCIYLVDMKSFNKSHEDKFHQRLNSKLVDTKEWMIQLSQMNTFNVLDMKYCIKWRIVNKS
ncbi:uncharacterized protein HGUI_01921 [Hanseniaspora guilliermondii]|uniref:Uncharacterized protein n=1 Tax=Hanseniaspora guilliermondii TaxID=56406 RepID=A0A1L0CMV6_9ASCO|nr:uncharacterized protein HGUI_01921 [Hanseniaspora guilliermondii]